MIAAALWALSAPASALSLSEIDLHSGLNQPLRASILLRNFDPVEVDRISVEIADDVMQAQYNGTTYLPTPISASLRSTKSGTYIDLTSPTAVNEPFLKFAVQLNAPDGMILRQYEVLIDPPKSLYKPAPSRPAQQFASHTTPPAAVQKLKNSIKLTASDQANGIELAVPASSALKVAPVKEEPNSNPMKGATPAVLSTLTEPNTLNPQLAQSELPRVAALIDRVQPRKPQPVPVQEKLFETTEMSTEEFLASLDEYSLTKVLAPVRTKKQPESNNASEAIPETAALIKRPGKAQPQAANTGAPASQAIPAGRVMGSASARFRVRADDFSSNDADSVARALMDYRDQARAGKKTQGQLNALMQMSANGVKRVPSTGVSQANDQ